ncbi:MAG: hypothetical protein DRP71_05345 [Verrucomicrobia bacterium]|nr:MAG: hypothetical protein DRP71_05345 [Verrucomicrobiota bacterium]
MDWINSALPQQGCRFSRVDFVGLRRLIEVPPFPHAIARSGPDSGSRFPVDGCERGAWLEVLFSCQVGDIASEEIIAPVDLEVIDPKATAQARHAAVRFRPSVWMPQ